MRQQHEDFAITAPAPARPTSILRRLRHSAAAWLRRMAEAREARRVGARLVALDEHILRDIGVSRDEAERIARGGGD